MKTLRLLLLAAALTSLNASARTPVTVVNHENVPIVRTAGPATVEQVRKAIERAASDRGWQVSSTGPDRVIATMYVKGKHTLSTDITFTPTQFTVRYRDSVNLHYTPGGPAGTGTIHPGYNKWVELLVDAIRVEVSN